MAYHHAKPKGYYSKYLYIYLWHSKFIEKEKFLHNDCQLINHGSAKLFHGKAQTRA